MTEISNHGAARDKRIIFTQNNRVMGTENGMPNTVTYADEHGLAVQLDTHTAKAAKRPNPHHYCSFDCDYAVIVRKPDGRASHIQENIF